MGTNYYVKERECKHCGRRERRHIGKSANRQIERRLVFLAPRLQLVRLGPSGLRFLVGLADSLALAFERIADRRQIVQRRREDDLLEFSFRRRDRQDNLAASVGDAGELAVVFVHRYSSCDVQLYLVD